MANQTTDGLTIAINGDNRRFKKSITETKGILAGRMSVAAGSIGGLVTGAVLLKGVSVVREYTDNLLDLSVQTGLSVQELQSLNEVFARQGIGLNQAIPLLDQMSKKLFEASLGTGEATRALDILGLKADQLKGKNLQEQFFMITKAMEGLSREDQRQVALNLFGESGAKMLLVMVQGMDEINRQREKAVKLSKDDLTEIKKFNDELAVTWARMQAIGSRELNPMFKMFNDLLGGDSMGKILERNPEGVQKFVETTTSGLALIAPFLDKLEKNVENLVTEMIK